MITTKEGIPSDKPLSFAPDFSRRILAHMEWQSAKLRQTYSNGPDPGPPIDHFAPAKCEVCGDPHYMRGWCRKHYRVLKSGGDPFADPTPTLGRVGRPAKKGARFVQVHLRTDVVDALDARLAGSNETRTAAVHAILRDFLGLVEPQTF